MKRQHNLFKLSLCLATILTFGMISGCQKSSSDPQPAETEADKIVKILSTSTWKLQTVTVDGTDQTSTYKGLVLNFTSSSFTTTHGGAVWPASGAWKFSDGTTISIDRGDGLKISLQEVTDGKLSLGLLWSKNTLGPGRVNSLKGQHVFIFGK